jgi:hypothetical protein
MAPIIGYVPPGWDSRWADSQRREARRPADDAADQVRAGHQCKDRQATRPRGAPYTARPRRRVLCLTRAWARTQMPAYDPGIGKRRRIYLLEDVPPKETRNAKRQ